MYFLQHALARFRSFTHLSELALYHRDAMGLLDLDVLVAGGTAALEVSQSQDAKLFRVWAYDDWSLGYVAHMERWPEVPRPQSPD
jgi:hypothetical protein